MQVYKRILVAMDCSPVDAVIVEHVSALALQNEAEVCLLHVVHSHTLDQDRALRERAQACLRPHLAAMREKGINAAIVIRGGEPDEGVLAEINEGNYDLVAMATHGHSFFGDLLFGSVSRTVKHKISVPLLLIGPQRD